MTKQVASQDGIIERLVAEAVRLGADYLEIEYKDRHEMVFAAKGGVGFGIASFPSASLEAAELRAELYRLAKRKQRVAICEFQYVLRTSVYKSFGEDAFRMELCRV
jgi:hypothetical protein